MYNLENYLYSTVRISSSQKDGSTISATGFFYTLMNNPDKPVLVCNSHLMRNAESSTIYFHMADENGNITTEEHVFTVSDIKEMCAFNTDEANDICIINFYNLFPFIKKNNIRLFYTCLTDKMIPTEDDIKNIFLGDDIFLVGYPDALYDRYNKIPIFRKGILATPYTLSYNETNTFLIDAAIYNGSSGSPIFCPVNDKILLLGIQKSVHLHNISVNSEYISTNIRIPNHLGLVTKSNVLLDIPT